MYTVAECVSLAQFEALRPEWEALLDRAARPHIFAAWTWVEATWRYAAPGKEPLVLLVRDDGGALVGGLPLARARRGRVLHALEVLGSMPSGYPIGDYGGVLAARGVEPRVWQVLMAYLARRGGWSVLDLRNCPPGMLGAGDAGRWVQQAATAHGWEARVMTADPCRLLALPGTFDGYLATLSANTRQQIRRKMRKLDEAGITITAVEAQDTAGRAAALEHLFDYHQARWAADPSGGAFPNEWTRDLQRYLAPRLAEQGALDLRVARGGDGTCLGVMYNFRRNGVGYFVIMGLHPDPQWQAYSLGTCLLASSIAAACAAGCHTFDLLRGEHDYKRHFGGETYENLRVTIYRYRWLPVLAEAGRGVLRRLRGGLAAGRARGSAPAHGVGEAVASQAE